MINSYFEYLRKVGSTKLRVLLSFYIILLLIYFFNFVTPLGDNDFYLEVLIILCSVSLALLFPTKSNEEKLKIYKISEYVFFLSLVLLFLSNNLNIEALSNEFSFILLSILICTGLLIIRKNDQGIYTKQGLTSSQAKFTFFIIIISFVLLRGPYFLSDFTGLHDMKYSTYVEPVKEMLLEGPLHIQQKYLSNPITNFNGTSEIFGTYPIIEWGIYSISSLLPYGSVELATRIFMTTIGILILFELYKLLRKFLPRDQCLVITGIFSTTYIFNFFTFVTTYDPLNVLFLLVSLNFLINGINTKRSELIYISGLIAGLGISLKFHALVFYPPLFLYFLFVTKKINISQKILFSMLLFPSFILETILFRISFRQIPENYLFYGSIFILLILARFFIYFIIKKYSSVLAQINLSQRIQAIFFVVSIISVALLAGLSLTVSWISQMLKDFTTDSYLILNSQLYSTLINRYVEWLGFPIVLISLCVLLSFILINSSSIRKKYYIAFAFVLTSILYFSITIKVLYFHEYYHHIIILTIIICFSYFIELLKKFDLKYLAVASGIIILLTVIPHNLAYTKTKLSINRTNEVFPVANFLNISMDEQEFFIRDVNTIPTSISFYSNRKSFEAVDFITNKDFNLYISTELSKGKRFNSVMKELKVKYVVTRGINGFDKPSYVQFFDTQIKTKVNELPIRTQIILCKVNKVCLQDTIQTNSKVEDTFNTLILTELNLEEVIGNYYIYSFY